MPKPKVYIHERPIYVDVCLASWAEYDTMAPHEVRHECKKPRSHTEYGIGLCTSHVCSCGMVDEHA